MGNDIRVTVAYNLKRLRQERGLSMTQLREKTGVDIWAIENYRSNTTLDTITKVADALQVSPTDLTCDRSLG